MKTKIQWTGRVWNPVTGCSKVSQGCKHCYAETIARRFWGDRNFTDVRLHPERLFEPTHWRKPSMVFVNSMSDLFHEDVPESFIREVWRIMGNCPEHTFQILTKRPVRMARRFATDLDVSELPNVWLGVSVEDQLTAENRIPLLLGIPAFIHWVSVEPMLGPIDLEIVGLASLDWVVVGGESGPGARPCDPQWIRGIINQCQEAGVACFVKQLGSNPTITDIKRTPTRTYFKRGKLKDRKGGDSSEWPEYLRVREYPWP